MNTPLSILDKSQIYQALRTELGDTSRFIAERVDRIRNGERLGMLDMPLIQVRAWASGANVLGAAATHRLPLGLRPVAHVARRNLRDRTMALLDEAEQDLVEYKREKAQEREGESDRKQARRLV